MIWVMENFSTIIICAVLIAVVAVIIINMVKNKKRDKFSCGCGCSCCSKDSICPMSGGCCQNK